ncbi:CBASS cGAMP synthase [Acinetobacter baumannii]|nr:CBASS cGAMP synthase [Acinetobacter baumannii]
MLSQISSNLHLVYQDVDQGYASKLLPPPGLVDLLKSCQKKVRNKLEKALKDKYNETPKFRVQGSFAYGTCNIPAQPHQGQELDLDYGAYLPVRVFTLNTEGTPDSAEEAKNYIDVTFNALKELCEENSGWKLERKPSCLRIYGVAPHAHMDVPLYAVPNEMFDELESQHALVMDSMQKATPTSLQEKYAGRSIGLESYETDFMQEISENESLIDLNSIDMIHMAKDDGTWFPSDCEKVREWFKRQCAKYPNNGRQLRFIARYLKGWRDQQWDEKGPTSIVLMIAAVKNYIYCMGRDDLALLSVTANLDTVLANNIYVSDMEDHEEEDFNRSNSSQRIENARAARMLHSNLTSSQTIGLNDGKASLEILTSLFGIRIPKDTSLIRQDHESSQDPIAKVINAPAVQRNSSVELKSQSSG